MDVTQWLGIWVTEAVVVVMVVTFVSIVEAAIRQFRDQRSDD